MSREEGRHVTPPAQHSTATLPMHYMPQDSPSISRATHSLQDMNATKNVLSAHQILMQLQLVKPHANWGAISIQFRPTLGAHSQMWHPHAALLDM